MPILLVVYGNISEEIDLEISPIFVYVYVPLCSYFLILDKYPTIWKKLIYSLFNSKSGVVVSK